MPWCTRVSLNLPSPVKWFLKHLLSALLETYVEETCRELKCSVKQGRDQILIGLESEDFIKDKGAVLRLEDK